jgi:DNA uptake protein ComE-like DNA-binding protein
MPTSSEQKALAFIAIIVLLGGAVRVLRAGTSSPTASEQQAIASQASAADSSATKRKGKAAKRAVSKRAAHDTSTIGGVASVPPSFARPDRPYDHTPYGTPSARMGFPPPDPRIDTDARGQRAASPAPITTSGAKKLPATPIDLDTANQQQIESLPRIGPAFAKRIVANRDSLGPFGSIEGLKRVKGMGKATLAQLAPLVTFSGRR